MASLLDNVYNPEQFRTQAHSLVDILADYLESAVHDDKRPVFKPFKPEVLYREWRKKLDHPSSDTFSEWSQKVIDDSIRLHNPRYAGHQVSPVLPQAALADFMGALLNNGVGVYEMGSPTVAMERAVINHLAGHLGFSDDADGVLTSGGTLGNLTALLAMRQVKSGGDFWNEGTGNRQLAIMVSEEAHYSVSRAVKILGWGESGIVQIPVDKQFRLDASLLEDIYHQKSEEGIQILGLVGSSCSTATGSFDPLPALADFCQQHDLWFHVDAAHGGAAIYSERYRPLVKGIDRADSVIVDFHKMLMCPALVTGLLFKNGDHSYQSFSQKAEYLWEQQGREWYNLGKRTFECTKDMMALKVYSVLHSYGTALFKENIERLFDLAKAFGEVIAERQNFELLAVPQSNIVCFRHSPPGIKDINIHNANIREQLINDGEYFIVQATINGKRYLRTTLMNPFTSTDHLKALLQQIEVTGCTN